MKELALKTAGVGLFSAMFIFSAFYSPLMLILGMNLVSMGTAGMIGGWIIMFSAMPSVLSILTLELKVCSEGKFGPISLVVVYNTIVFLLFRIFV